MRNYRFTISDKDSLDQGSGRILIKDADLLHQINNVLRLNSQSKEQISFIDGSGEIFEAVMIASAKDAADFKIQNSKKSSKELKTKVKFYIPAIKNEAFAFMIRKLTELGVQDLVPVGFSRSQKQNIDAFNRQGERNRKIIQEATEQCEGAVFANLHELIEFAKVDADADINIFASERLAESDEDDFQYIQGLINKAHDSATVNLLVGPEGGLSDEEVETLESMGYKPCGLGRRLLKAETAAISLFSQLQVR